MMELLHVLSAGRSVRAYQDTPVEDAQLAQILKFSKPKMAGFLHRIVTPDWPVHRRMCYNECIVTRTGRMLHPAYGGIGRRRRTQGEQG